MMKQRRPEQIINFIKITGKEEEGAQTASDKK